MTRENHFKNEGENPLDALIKRLAKLPGFGTRSARRALLHLMKNRDNLMLPLAASLAHVAETIKTCTECGNLDTSSICAICQNDSRDKNCICVVEDVDDLWAIERASIFSGQYHVLGGVLSAIDGVGPNQLRIKYLIEKAARDNTEEVILAMAATVDGQTTAHYIAEKLENINIKVSRLAHGVPVGGELDYLDDGTLAQAMRARRNVNE